MAGAASGPLPPARQGRCPSGVAGLKDDFLAVVFLVLENVIAAGRLLERQGVGDDAGGIDLAVLDPLQQRVSAENPVTLCDLGILADQAAEPVPAENLDVCAWSRWLPTSGRRALLQRPVRTMLVVVIDVLAEDQSQVPFAGYQHPVQALAAGTGDPPFGDSVRPRSLDRCFDDPHADGGEYGVEGRGELGVPVADQELQAASLVFDATSGSSGAAARTVPWSPSATPSSPSPGTCCLIPMPGSPNSARLARPHRAPAP
jgi:hypothetical protein